MKKENKFASSAELAESLVAGIEQVAEEQKYRLLDREGLKEKLNEILVALAESPKVQIENSDDQPGDQNDQPGDQPRGDDNAEEENK